MGKALWTRQKRRTRTEDPCSEYWETAARSVWAEYVFRRWGGKCAVSGLPGNLERHHLISRRRKWLRWDHRNGMLLSAEHHHGTRLSPHGNPDAFAQWLSEHHPDILRWINANKRHIERPNYKRSYYETLDALVRMDSSNGQSGRRVHGRTISL